MSLNIRKLRKKPVVIEGVQFIDNPDQGRDIARWCAGQYDEENHQVLVNTIEGTMAAGIGWWVLKGVEGEFYPCKDSVLQATYEVVVYDPDAGVPAEAVHELVESLPPHLRKG